MLTLIRAIAKYKEIIWGQRWSDQTSNAVIPYINPPPSWDRVGLHSPERSYFEALTIVLLTSFYSHVNTQLSSGIRVELFSTYEIRGWLPIPELISTGAKDHHQWTLPLEISRSNFLTQRQFYWLVNTYDHISRLRNHIWLPSHFGCEWDLNSSIAQYMTAWERARLVHVAILSQCVSLLRRYYYSTCHIMWE